MIGNMREELRKSKSLKYGIPAINFINAQMMKGIICVAERHKSPIIVSLAQAHLDLISLKEAFNAYEYYASQSTQPVVLHLDHGQDVAIVKQAIDHGFKSVMIDGSSLSFDENVKITSEIVQYARKHNVFVEGEIGHVGSGNNYESETSSDSVYTNVDDAVKFVELTGVDSLAISIGTAHGHYTGTPKINFDLLSNIFEVVQTPLVLHGGSSSGDSNLKKAISLGITKVNLFTDIVSSINKEIENTESIFDVEERTMLGIDNSLKHYLKLFDTERGGI